MFAYAYRDMDRTMLWKYAEEMVQPVVRALKRKECTPLYRSWSRGPVERGTIQRLCQGR